MAGSEAPVVRVICGPTAAGKTAAALQFAAQHDIAVVSADSRQLYRGFDLGTAKPSPDERARVPHHGLDVLDPTTRASAAWWAQFADAWMLHILAEGRVPVVVGGTGLYLRALFGPLFAEPQLDPSRRSQLQAELDLMTTDELRRWVTQLDPARAHLGRTQLLRATEIALLSGRRVSDLHRENARPAVWRARYLVVDPGPPLAEAIAARTSRMLHGGWPDEVRVLAASVPADAPAWNATGYRAIRDMVQGLISSDEAERRVVIETRQYAKRQRTWFRHQLATDDVTRLDPRAADWPARSDAWWGADTP